MFGLFSNKYRKYSYIWAKNSEWAIYRSMYEYRYLHLNITENRSNIYRIWKYLHPESSIKPISEIIAYINDLPEGWHKIRVISNDDVQKYMDLSDKYECECKIEIENVVDYDIAHIETSESIICPEEIFDDLVQFAIKKGAKIYGI